MSTKTQAIPDPELLRVTRELYVKLAQTHPGDLADEEGWLDEWNEVARVLAERERAAV